VLLRRQRVTMALAVAVMACGDRGASGGGTVGAAASVGHLEGTLLVSAAASLTDAFADLESAFEATHTGVDVVLNLGGSSSLREQILEGAPADIFASADPTSMERVVEAGHVSGEPQVFARNRLQIAVPADNPAGIEDLSDLADATLRVGLCAEAVPCGDFARQALERAGVAPSLDTNEPNVRALLTKIELGELDAGITYVTDVASTKGAVKGIDIPADVNIMAAYPIAVLAAARNPAAAHAFVRLVLSDEGRAILTRHRFDLP
jgi:molybdate transport system substrate-binding protein